MRSPRFCRSSPMLVWHRDENGNIYFRLIRMFREANSPLVSWSALRTFVSGLRDKLDPRSRVIIIDMLPSEELARWFSHYDDDGNLIHKRTFPDGEVFEVVKNFPTEPELKEVLDGLAYDIEYREHDALRRWMVSFTASPDGPSAL